MAADVRFIANFVQRGVWQTAWIGVPLGTLGLPDNLSRFPVHSVQIGGVFGGATATLEGSDDGVTYTTLTGENPAGGSRRTPVPVVTSISPMGWVCLGKPYVVR